MGPRRKLPCTATMPHRNSMPVHTGRATSAVLVMTCQNQSWPTPSRHQPASAFPARESQPGKAATLRPSRSQRCATRQISRQRAAATSPSLLVSEPHHERHPQQHSLWKSVRSSARRRRRVPSARWPVRVLRRDRGRLHLPACWRSRPRGASC
jgi:hypothetical protein